MNMPLTPGHIAQASVLTSGFYGKPYGTLPTKMSFYYKLCTLVGVSNFRRCCLYLVGRRVYILSADMFHLVGRRCLHLVGRRCLHLVGRRCSILSADYVCILSADDVSSCRPTMFHLVGRRCSILSADDVSSCRPTMFASLTYRSRCLTKFRAIDISMKRARESNF